MLEEETAVIEDDSEIEVVEDSQEEERQDIEANEPETGEEVEVSESADLSGEEDDEETVITLEGESPPENEQEDGNEFRGKEAPQWVKDMRKENRELKKQLKAKTEAETQEQEPKLRQKPTLEKPNEDPKSAYDNEVYERELEKWFDEKREVEDYKRKQQDARKRQDEEWQARQEVYNQRKKALKLSDFDDVEDVVKDHLDVSKQGMIVHAAKDPAALTYLIGTRPVKELEQLSKLDPIQFAFAAGELQAQMKVGKRKASVQPERKIKGGAKMDTNDGALDRLRKDAERTGDYTKVIAYKRNLRSKKQLKT